MKRITKIEEDIIQKQKIRVAAYCRVSTASDDQIISLDTQKAHYERYITSNEDWEYAGIFYDEGITGTKKECRNGLMALIKACEDGKIDRIITKSISRFSRSTTDCLELVRKLLTLGVTVVFEKENIDTSKMESELMLSILSGLAESESRSISENNKWSIQKKFQNGTFVISYQPYGYKNVGGEMTVIPEQAIIVKQIFEDILKGESTHSIACALNEKGVKTKKGSKWSAGTVNAIIKNEKYIGDVICQKTYTDSEFNRHRNDGNLTQYLWENHHEPIIDRDTFSKANAMLLQRAKEKGNGINTERYQNRYALSSKVICAECGGVFKRRKHYKPSGDYIAWCCNNHINYTKPCSMKYITDDAIKAAILTMKNKLIFAEDILLKPLLYSLQGFDDKDRLLNIEAIENQLEKVTEERQVLASLISSGLLEPGMASSENNKLNARERQLTAEKESIMNFVLGDRDKIRELEKLMKHLPQEMTADDFFLEFVDKILVLSREEIQLELKCGLRLKERLVAK